jgi:4-hydroxybenzoate polyprenyltransferase
MVARMEAKGVPVSFWHSGFARLLLWMPGILAALMLFDGQKLRPVMILADFSPLLPLILIFLFAAIVAMTSRIMKQGGPAIGRAVGILLAGIPVVDALAVSQISLPLACGFVALAPLLRLWQRWIAAT